MIYIGCHLSAADGYEAMGKAMGLLGGNTFAWFMRNPRGGKTKPLDISDAEALRLYMQREGFGPAVAHGSYTMNLCSADPQTRSNGLDMLRQDLAKMEALPGNMYNFHPGSHTGQGAGTGIGQIADALDKAVPRNAHTAVLLETMAGKGSEIGGCFEELREIIDRAECGDRIGVCFDTCHVWDAGYDLAVDLDGVLRRFDDIVGLGRLKAVHFNDSKNPRGSRRDRHERLGRGAIGMEALERIALHPALQGLPFILETPNDGEGYAQEIRTVLGWMERGT